MSTVRHLQPFTPPSREGEARAPVVPIEQVRSLGLKEVELPKEALLARLVSEGPVC